MGKKLQTCLKEVTGCTFEKKQKQQVLCEDIECTKYGIVQASKNRMVGPGYL